MNAADSVECVVGMMAELKAAVEKSCREIAYFLKKIAFMLNRRYPIGKVTLRRRKAIKRSRRNNETVKRFRHGRTQRTRVKR